MVAGDSVYFGSCNGLFRRLDATTGKVQWETNVRDGRAKQYFFHGDAVLAADRIEADGTGDCHVPSVDISHDRAVFHFLTNADDRVRYVAHLRTALRPGGSAIIATFAPDGPEKCSGLPCVRYCPDYAGI